jgi:hypothetical protein
LVKCSARCIKKRLRQGWQDFSWFNIPKRGKTYQIRIKYTKWPQNIPNVRKIDQMAIIYTNISYCYTLQNFPNWDFLFENIGIIWQPWAPSPNMIWSRLFQMFGLIVLFKKVENLREIKAHVLLQNISKSLPHSTNSKHTMYLHTYLHCFRAQR